MTVAELLDRMSSAEFSEWMAYYDLEPFGEERADFRQALTTSAVHNSLQAQTKSPKWTKPGDFMPFSEKPQKKASDGIQAGSPESMLAKFNALTSKKQKG